MVKKCPNPECELEYRGSWSVKYCMECGTELLEEEEKEVKKEKCK